MRYQTDIERRRAGTIMDALRANYLSGHPDKSKTASIIHGTIPSGEGQGRLWMHYVRIACRGIPTKAKTASIIHGTIPSGEGQ